MNPKGRPKDKTIICLIDFDNTLIGNDSLKYICLREKFHLSPTLFLFGIGILVGKFLSPKIEILSRNNFKKHLLLKLKGLSKNKTSEHVKYFQSILNHQLISEINNTRYTQKIIISASEYHIIHRTLENTLRYDHIISNDYNNITNHFQTCWGKNKLDRLRHHLGENFTKKYVFHLYTDSYEDEPLMDICSKISLIRH